VLDAYIIEQLRKREEERRRIYERPALELPLPMDDGPRRREHEAAEEDHEPSHVIVIDL